MALTVTAVMVTGVSDPAELGMPAAPPHPPEVGLAALNLNLTAVVETPAKVNLGEKLPVPVILHATDPVALGGGAALPTPSPTTADRLTNSANATPVMPISRPVLMALKLRRRRLLVMCIPRSVKPQNLWSGERKSLPDLISRC
jgi:hypothetical protein